MIKKLKGPRGIVLELNSKEICPKDPGNGTPALVHYRGGISTLTCAENTCCVDGGREGDIDLPHECLDWLGSDEIQDEVESMYSAGENGKW